MINLVMAIYRRGNSRATGCTEESSALVMAKALIHGL